MIYGKHKLSLINYKVLQNHDKSTASWNEFQDVFQSGDWRDSVGPVDQMNYAVKLIS